MNLRRILAREPAGPVSEPAVDFDIPDEYPAPVVAAPSQEPASNDSRPRRDKPSIDLSGQDLRGVDLAGKNLRRANLSGSWLQGADLHSTNLREADLREADLTEVRGLTATQLGGSVLQGARLPAALAKFEALHTVEALTAGAGRSFVLMLALTAFLLLALAPITDVQIFAERGAIRLPLVGSEVPTRAFFRFAPLLLLGCYTLFQLYLLRLWEAVSHLPAVFPDGRRLDERIGSWLLLGFARNGFWQLRNRRPPLARLQDFTYALLTTYLLPVTLLLFWARFLVRRNWSTTLLHIIVIAAAVALGGLCFELGRSYLRDGRIRRRGLRDHQIYLPAVIVAALLLYLSHGAIHGLRHNSGDPSLRRLSNASARMWFPAALTSLGFSPFANFHDMEVSLRPTGWTGREDEFNTLRIVHLARADLRYADGWKAFMANADLESASLQFADFTRADLRHARLFQARLRYARFIGADLRHTDLTQADLHNADLSGARLQMARLRSANLQHAKFLMQDDQNADLTGANMMRAQLQEADFHYANLHGVNLQYADLTDARLQFANLSGADLRNATLGGINLTNATYNRQTKWPPNFNPDQMGAHLLGG